MKLIVITDSRYFEGEENLIHGMFEAGLETLHVRKPKMSTENMKVFLEKIDKKYYPRIVIHSHHELAYKYGLGGIHLSEKHRKNNFFETWIRMKYLRFKRPDIRVSTTFHDLGTLTKSTTDYAYVFLSPIFDSISKVGYKNRFNNESLIKAIGDSKFKIIAMGGVDEHHIQEVQDMGFYGCACLGSVWMSDDPVNKFKAIQSVCKEVSPVS